MKKCKKCGAEVSEEFDVCPRCGGTDFGGENINKAKAFISGLTKQQKIIIGAALAVVLVAFIIVIAVTSSSGGTEEPPSRAEVLNSELTTATTTTTTETTTAVTTTATTTEVTTTEKPKPKVYTITVKHTDKSVDAAHSFKMADYDKVLSSYYEQPMKYRIGIFNIRADGSEELLATVDTIVAGEYSGSINGENNTCIKKQNGDKVLIDVDYFGPGGWGMYYYDITRNVFRDLGRFSADCTKYYGNMFLLSNFTYSADEPTPIVVYDWNGNKLATYEDAHADMEHNKVYSVISKPVDGDLDHRDYVVYSYKIGSTEKTQIFKIRTVYLDVDVEKGCIEYGESFSNTKTVPLS